MIHYLTFDLGYNAFNVEAAIESLINTDTFEVDEHGERMLTSDHLHALQAQLDEWDAEADAKLNDGATTTVYNPSTGELEQSVITDLDEEKLHELIADSHGDIDANVLLTRELQRRLARR